MDRATKQIYLEEIEAKCQYAIMTLDRADTILESPPPARDPNGMKSYVFNFFEALTAHLHHVYSVARVLFPDTKYNKNKDFRLARAAEIRAFLGIDESNALNNTSFRHHLAHTDERIDEWIIGSSTKSYFRQNIQPLSELMRQHIQADELSIFENFDPSSRLFHFRGDYFDLNVSRTVIEDILARTLAAQQA